MDKLVCNSSSRLLVLRQEELGGGVMRLRDREGIRDSLESVIVTGTGIEKGSRTATGTVTATSTAIGRTRATVIATTTAHAARPPVSLRPRRLQLRLLRPVHLRLRPLHRRTHSLRRTVPLGNRRKFIRLGRRAGVL